ncbi:hypothetical protein JXQ70_07180 [bacterium]|nr:hypothetical protein [bacterium]
MTEKEFLNSIARDHTDILQQFLAILDETGSPYCIIGGLAVNAYVEPVISLDIDVVVAVQNIGNVIKAISIRHWKSVQFEHSLNISAAGSDLRIQIQTDPRYQKFIDGSEIHSILGYDLKVASLKDVLTGKVWAYSDIARRPSKRQKDLADIMRIVEEYPDLMTDLPQNLQKQLQSGLSDS